MFTQNTWSVFRYELARNIQRKGYLFTTFGLPLVALAVFFFLLQSGANVDPTSQLQELDFDLQAIQTAGYVDQSGFFDEPGAFAADVMQPYASVDAADDALDADEIDVYYVIPSDYLETGQIDLYAPSFSIGVLTDDPVQQMFYSRLLEQGLQMGQLQLLANPANIQVNMLEAEGAVEDTNTEEESNTIITIFSILMTFAILGTNGYLMQTVIEEKENRLVEILLSSVRPVQLLAGKILALCILGLLQLIVYVVTLLIALNIGGAEEVLGSLTIEPGLLLVAVVFFLLGYLLFSAFFGSIGALASNVQEGSGFVSMFVIIAILPWLLSTPIIQEPNGGLAVILSYFPLTSPLGMVTRASVTDVSIIEYAISVGLLVVSIVAMMWVAGRLFRVQSLLAGKMPPIRDIPKLIFGS